MTIFRSDSKRTSDFFAVSCVLFAFSLNIFLTAEASVRCRSDQFRCRDGSECVRVTYRCDGSGDCDDESDEADCDTTIHNNFLLVSVTRDKETSTHIRPQIFQVDLLNGNTKPLLATDPDIPASLTIDHHRRILYYVERKIEAIISLSLDHLTNSSRVVYRDPGLTADLDGLALDSLTQKLYFCDGGTEPKVVEISLTDEDKTLRIIHSGRRLKPKSIVVDEANKELFWTDWGTTPGIFVIGIEPGAQKRSLIVHNIVMPNALAIDFKEEVMYWVDAHYDRIEKAKLNGEQRSELFRESVHQDSHYYAMAISPLYLYICDWTNGNVQRFQMRNRSISDQMPSIAGKKTGIAYYNSSYNNTGRCRPDRVDILSRFSTLVSSPTTNSEEGLVVVTDSKSTAETTTSSNSEDHKSTKINGVITEDQKSTKINDVTTEAQKSTKINDVITEAQKSTKINELTKINDFIPTPKPEKLTSTAGLQTETLAVIVLASLVLFVVLLSLIAWCGVRKRRRVYRANRVQMAEPRSPLWPPAEDSLRRENALGIYERLSDDGGVDLCLDPTHIPRCQAEEWYTPLNDYVEAPGIRNVGNEYYFVNGNKDNDHSVVKENKDNDYSVVKENKDNDHFVVKEKKDNDYSFVKLSKEQESVYDDIA